MSLWIQHHGPAPQSYPECRGTKRGWSEVSWSFLSRKDRKVSPHPSFLHTCWNLPWPNLVFLVGVSRLESLGEPGGSVSLKGLKLWTLGALCLGVLGGDLDSLLPWGDLERDGDGEDSARSVDNVGLLVEDWTGSKAAFWILLPTFHLNSWFLVSIHFTGSPVLEIRVFFTV